MANNTDYSVTVQTKFDQKQATTNWKKLLKELEKESKLKLSVNHSSLKEIRNDLEALNKSPLSKQKQSWNLISKEAKEFHSQIEQILTQMNSLEKNSGLQSLQKQLQNISANVSKTSSSVSSSADMDSITSWMPNMGIINNTIELIQNMTSAIQDTKDAMEKFCEATDETSTSYNNFLTSTSENAKKLGRSISSLINQSTVWADAGFNLSQIEELTKVSSIYANISGLDEETAVSSLVTAMGAFNITASKSINIVDKLSNLGSKYSASSKDLGTGLSNSASALAAAGNTIDQSLSMLTAMTEVTKNASESSNALKVLSMRLRNASGELKASGESTEGMCNSIEVLREKIMALTTMDHKSGIDIMLDDNTLKSTYDIMQGIAAVWSDMSAVNQTALLELIAGSQQNNNIAALLTNMSGANDILSDSIHSSGTAYQEQSEYMDSLESKTQQFETALQSLSNAVISSEVLEYLIDIGTFGVNALDKVFQHINPLISTMTGFTIFWQKDRSKKRFCPVWV